MSKKTLSEKRLEALRKGREKLAATKGKKSEVKKEVEEKAEKNDNKKVEESFVPVNESTAFNFIKENTEVYKSFFNSDTAFEICLNEAEIKQLNIGYNEFCERYHSTAMLFASGNGNPSLTSLLDLYEAGIILFTTLFTNKEFGMAFTTLNNIIGVSGIINILNPDVEIPVANTFMSYFEKILSLIDEEDYVFSERINLLISELSGTSTDATEEYIDDEVEEDYHDSDDSEEEYDEDDDSYSDDIEEYDESVDFEAIEFFNQYNVNEMAVADKKYVDALASAMEKHKDPKLQKLLKLKKN